MPILSNIVEKESRGWHIQYRQKLVRELKGEILFFLICAIFLIISFKIFYGYFVSAYIQGLMMKLNILQIFDFVVQLTRLQFMILKWFYESIKN